MSTAYLIGKPVGHSLSPAMHDAAFAALGLPHRYKTREVDEADLRATIEKLRSEDTLGANVTIPHKEAVLPLVDEASEDARRIGAVNTITRQGRRLVGDNTDRYGFRRALEERECVPADATVLVLGAGGAARACAIELVERNEVLIANRGYERAEALAVALGVAGTARPIRWEDAQRLVSADAIVNATPLGLQGEDALEGFSFKRLPGIVVDLVPTAEETALVRRAREAQHVRVVDGLLMLLHQAARSFALWTGVDPPLAVMRAALPRPV